MTNVCDVMGIIGNGASFNAQTDAGIADADLMIAVTGSDELNLLCCLIAKKAGNCHTIARIRNPEYSAEIGYIREELNLSMAINPELAAAREIARLLRFPSAIKIEPFAKGRIELLKLLIPDHSNLDQLKVMDVVNKLKSNVLICAVERGDDVVIPDGNFVMQKGDKISFIASHTDSADFFKKAGIVNNSVKTAMFVGGGKLTYYLCNQLADTKIKIKIIEQEESYTSKADITTKDYIPTYGVDDKDAQFSGLRIKRGLYRCADGTILNADCHAAANIMRKAVPDIWDRTTDFSFLASPKVYGFHELNPKSIPVKGIAA